MKLIHRFFKISDTKKKKLLSKLLKNYFSSCFIICRAPV